MLRAIVTPPSWFGRVLLGVALCRVRRALVDSDINKCVGLLVDARANLERIDLIRRDLVRLAAPTDANDIEGLSSTDRQVSRDLSELREAVRTIGSDVARVEDWYPTAVGVGRSEWLSVAALRGTWPFHIHHVGLGSGACVPADVAVGPAVGRLGSAAVEFLPFDVLVLQPLYYWIGLLLLVIAASLLGAQLLPFWITFFVLGVYYMFAFVVQSRHNRAVRGAYSEERVRLHPRDVWKAVRLSAGAGNTLVTCVLPLAVVCAVVACLRPPVFAGILGSGGGWVTGGVLYVVLFASTLVRTVLIEPLFASCSDATASALTKVRSITSCGVVLLLVLGVVLYAGGFFFFAFGVSHH